MANALLEPDEEKLFQQLLLNSSSADGGLDPGPEPSFHKISLQPGFCLKTKSDKNEKVFINICISDNIPAPREITDEEVLSLLEAEDPSNFRVPMSLGEPHAELDNSEPHNPALCVDTGGQGCTAYDVVINPAFYQRSQRSDVLLGFFLTIVLEGLEYKYSLSLSREWKIMKNRKFLGSLPEQNVRSQSKPWIVDMDSENPQSGSKLISEIDSSEQRQNKPRVPEPSYTIIQEPTEGHPEYLIAEIHLPKLKSAAGMTLDVGEDRILLETRANCYHLDIYLPYDLIQNECGAQFNRKSKILTMTMPVQPAS